MKCKQCDNQIPKDHKKFCSYDCFKKHSLKHRRDYLKCKNCKKDYSKKKSESKKGSTFCSKKCLSEYGRIELLCANCKTTFNAYKSRLCRQMNYCSRKCFFEHKRIRMLGKGNSNYRNGSRTITRIIRGLHRYLKWKKEVIERDKYICQFCKDNFPFKKLVAHHKIRLWKLIEEYPKKEIDVNDEYFYEIKNGLTLCLECHKKTYGKDEDIIE